MLKSLVRRAWFFYVIVPLGVLTPVLFTFLAARTLSRRQGESQAYDQTEQTARFTATVLEHQFHTTIEHLESIAQRPKLHRSIAHHNWRAVTEELRLNSTVYRGVAYLGVLSVQGGKLNAIYPPCPPALRTDFSQRDWYKGVTGGWTSYVSAVFQPAASPHSQVVGVAVPVFDDNGGPIAVLVAGHRLDSASSWLRELERSSAVTVEVVDQQGHILSSRNTQEMTEPLDASSKEVSRRVLAGEMGKGVFFHHGKPAIVNYRPIQEFHWGVLAELPLERAYVASHRFQYAVLPMAILLACCVVYFALSVVRITQAAEKRLRAYRSVVKSSADAIIVINRDLTVQSWNAGADRLYGFRSDEMVGQPFKTIFPSERMGELSANLARLKHGEFIRFETERLTRTGQRITVNVTNSAITDAAGHLLGYSAVARDIGQRKKIEHELQRANADLAKSVRSLEDRGHQLAILGELSGALQSCLSSPEAYDVVARHCQALLQVYAGARGAVLKLTDGVLELAASWNHAMISDRRLGLQSCWALRRGQSYIVDTERRTPRCEHHAGSPLPSMCLPLVAQGEAMGILYVERCETGSFSSIEIELATAAAQQISLGLGNVALREKLQNQSIRDPLTGIYNRRHLQDLLPREIRRMERSGQPVAFLLIDVDFFKTINDICGHDAGDVVLKSLARVLQSHVRGEDIVFRFGGEEFCVILPGADHEAARRRAEMIRESVMLMPLTGSKIGPLTVSIGVAVTGEANINSEQLVKAADEALYEAKKSGRNRVVVSLRRSPNGPPPPPLLTPPDAASNAHCS